MTGEKFDVAGTARVKNPGSVVSCMDCACEKKINFWSQKMGFMN